MKIYRIFAVVMFFFLPFFMSCTDKKNPDTDEKIENMKNRMDLLAKRIASLEERLYRSQKNEDAEKKAAEPPKQIDPDVKPLPKTDRAKFPADFYFPEYQLRITEFKCYKGTGNIAAYFGNVVTEKDIQMLNLSIGFFDAKGKKIGGHVFPVKVISAKSPRIFQNGDTIEGGFEKVESMKLEVDFVSYSDFRMKGQAVERPQF